MTPDRQNNWWQTSIQNLRTSYYQFLARKIIPLSTFTSKLLLTKRNPLSVLIDSSTLGNAITHESFWIDTGDEMWGGQIPVSTGYLARVPVHAPTSENNIAREVRYLSGIAHLASTGYIKLYTSSELMTEIARQPMGRYTGYGLADHAAFRSSKFETVDGPPHISACSIAEQEQRISKCDDPLHLAIRHHLGPKQSFDAFHIYTAAKYGIDVFLHIDMKLHRSILNLARRDLFKDIPTKVFLPSEFAAMIKLLPVPTNVTGLADNGLFALRSDLHPLNQQRNKPRRK